MDMLLVVGGAYAGKRSIVRQRVDSYSWLSAYTGDTWEDWNMKWSNNTTLVMEGWEKWIEVALKQDLAMDVIRDRFGMFLRTLAIEEKERKDEVVLIMLEIGKGIVPVHAEDRMLRDVAGWFLQDAARKAEEVTYVWHGLQQKIKG
jgi:adenosylcobinamide kinase/adenosylcobinamide-phosphate guanylyltransferase